MVLLLGSLPTLAVSSEAKLVDRETALKLADSAARRQHFYLAKSYVDGAKLSRDGKRWVISYRCRVRVDRCGAFLAIVDRRTGTTEFVPAE
jgi:hypothetical protein